MKKQILYLCLFGALLTASSCSSHYMMSGVERSRILVDKRYDAKPDVQAQRFLAPYEKQVDSIMGPVVGSIDHYMAANKPESDLSNLLADILVWGAERFHEKADFAVYNMGGIRAAFAKGQVTYGDVLDVSPFENKICLLTLSGAKVLELFQNIAAVRGEGVSHGVQLVITKDGKLKSALLNGKEIDPKASYRVSTLDYLAQGNDKLYAFKDKTDLFSPQDKGNNVRFIIMDYFKEKAKQGESVNSKVEGRIVIE
jgi:2',3'-cyclic-nucleotide 2'-phosphodiesterase (5'-nucleotidase family)